jgi:uncharacterized protein YjbI with pentapeptide repeats
VLLKASQLSLLAAPLATLIALAAAPAHSEDSYVQAVGPIEATDCRARTVTVLGITFAAIDAGGRDAVCRAASTSGLRYVSIAGQIRSAGSISLTKLVSLSVGQYVPGATPVYLSGPVTQLRLDLGTVGVAGAVIGSASGDARVGSLIEAAGTQPLIGGEILPTTVRVLRQFEPVSSLEPVTSGENLHSAFGSGVSADSAIGSGTSLNSAIGSGTSINSAIGSGKSLNSAIGSGVSVDSIIGSGSSLNSAIGSGTSVNSAIGSGKSLNSAIGSETSINSAIGSGKSLNSVIGSGTSINSAIGSGKSLNSAIGSGASINSAIGSGTSLNSAIGSGASINWSQHQQCNWLRQKLEQRYWVWSQHQQCNWLRQKLEQRYWVWSQH